MRFVIIALFLLIATDAYAGNTEEQYAAFYGDGVRAYTESRYDEALTNLYRALAIKQSPYPLKLIVRSHDFQGNCTARSRAAGLLRDMFPGESVPGPQRCVTTGVLRIECAPDEGSVRVDDQFDAPCNAPLRVPIGRHVLNPKIGASLAIEVQRDKTTVANLTKRPSKWYLDDRHKKVVELPDRWLRPGLLTDPDMPRTFEWKRPANQE